MPQQSHSEYCERLEVEQAQPGGDHLRGMSRDQHNSSSDVAKAKLPTPDTCATCHSTQVDQYKKGKHSIAWAAMKAMPTIHWQPMAMIEGEKGCGGCHKIGLKTPVEIADLRQHGSEFGAAACDSCHTRHTFSSEEARQPQACESCHGIRSSTMGDVFLVEARGASRT
jgi:hypothetical protein